MQNISHFLDSTYLKLPKDSGLTEKETFEKVLEITNQAIENDFFLVMIRPEYVQKIKKYLIEKNSKVKVGTVIGFHQGDFSIQEKLNQAQKAIEDGADELDFVINYHLFKKNETHTIFNEFLEGNQLCLKYNKTIKWIIEIAALSDEEIAQFCQLLNQWAVENFKKNDLNKIFIKSSTGFYQTQNHQPNGATPEKIKIMIENSKFLPIKAAGGVKTPQEALEMINLGVKRIGTSSAIQLVSNQNFVSDTDY